LQVLSKGKTTMSLAKDLESQEDAGEDIALPPSELWRMSHPWKVTPAADAAAHRLSKLLVA